VCVQRAPLTDITNIQPLNLGLPPRRALSDPTSHTATSAASSSSHRSPLRPTHSPLKKIERAAIVVLAADGQSPSVIAAKLNCSPKAVRKWKEIYEDEGELEDAYKSGRKRLLTEEQMDVILEHATANPKSSTPREIKATYDFGCSAKTIRRALDDMGLFGRIAREVPPLNATHIKKRISFAEGYSEMDWSTVLWSDEMSIHCGPQGQTWVQRPIGEEWNPEYTMEKRKHPPKVHVWACFAAAGVGGIHVFTENLEKNLMKQILKDNLIKSKDKFWPTGQWWFQQDNDPKHSSRLVQNYLHSQGISCIDWPPYSPDLNPIENLWAHLKKRVEKHNCVNEKELEKAVKKEWNATTVEVCATLVASMPERCRLVIERKGGLTGY
jgi:transposase